VAKKLNPKDTIWFTHLVDPTEKAAKGSVKAYNNAARALNKADDFMPLVFLPDLPMMKANFKKGGTTRRPKRGGPKRGRR
jgi:hypothetical protein